MAFGLVESQHKCHDIPMWSTSENSIYRLEYKTCIGSSRFFNGLFRNFMMTVTPARTYHWHCDLLFSLILWCAISDQYQCAHKPRNRVVYWADDLLKRLRHSAWCFPHSWQAARWDVASILMLLYSQFTLRKPPSKDSKVFLLCAGQKPTYFLLGVCEVDWWCWHQLHSKLV